MECGRLHEVVSGANVADGRARNRPEKRYASAGISESDAIFVVRPAGRLDAVVEPTARREIAMRYELVIKGGTIVDGDGR